MNSRRNLSGAGWNVIKVLWGSDWDTLVLSAMQDHAPCCAALRAYG